MLCCRLGALALGVLIPLPGASMPPALPPVHQMALAPATPPPTVMTVREALRPLSLLVASGESLSVGDYNAANSGQAMDLGLNGLSSYFGRSCEQVTLGEVMNAQRRGSLHAVGRYQFIGSTLRFAVDRSGLSTSAMFSPVNQDALFRVLIKEKRPAVWSYLAGTGSEAEAANALAREWASLPGPWGGSYYPNGNRAHVSRVQVLSTLRQTKKAVLGVI